jgi:hypothetical protein
MRVHVVVTDDNGKTFEGEATLVAASGARGARKATAGKPKAPPAPAGINPNLSLPVRAFVKRHVKGLGGPQKFTALLARLADGKTGVAVARSEIEKNWNRMTALMDGKFNPAYSSRAKDNGWVDTPKIGHYALLPGWKEALDG